MRDIKHYGEGIFELPEATFHFELTVGYDPPHIHGWDEERRVLITYIAS